MKKQLLFFFFFGFLFLYTPKILFSQVNQALLFVEDFDVAGGTSFTLNSGMSSYGSNKWKINKDYSGDPTIPYATYTPSQAVTTGSIGIIGTPNGKYLHINNSLVTIPAEASFDPNQDAMQLAKMKNGFCTFGYSEVLMSFWWTCKGGPNAYGEVFYSIDGGGTWIPTKSTDGDSIYHNKDVWKYSVINMPEFLNRLDLRFGFRWYNVNAGANDTLPFAIDDVIIVGKTDSLTQPTIQTFGLSSATGFQKLCQMETGQVSFYFQPSDTLCVGNYAIELADSNCNFNNSTIIGYLNGAGPFYPILYAASGQLPIPTTIPQAKCYCFRINRIGPAPIITGFSSSASTGGWGCVEISDCVESVTTLQPAVLKDPKMTDSLGRHHVCIQSVVDCPFYSYGAYNPPNIYTLELSDSAGNFNAPFTSIGSLPDFTTWDPALPAPPMKPGSVSGKFPKKDANNNPILPGCNYYLRVSSSDPLVHGSPWGPFCLDECDIESNETVDITCCVTNTTGCSDSFQVAINMFDSTIHYNAGNTYLYQILNNSTMAVVYQGTIFGSLIDTTSGTFIFNITNLPAWLSQGLALKMYYLRIIATNSTNPNNALGTLIRITVNGVSGVPISISGPTQTLCGSKDPLNLTVSPNTSTSKYIWTFIGVFSTQPLAGPSVSFNISGLASGTYYVTVTEVGGGGCVGATSAPFVVKILAAPDVSILGDLSVCVGDTSVYSCNFQAATYYSWSQAGGRLVDSANNQIKVVWTTVGNGTVSLYALGYCGSEFNIENIVILPRPIISCRDTSICRGTTVRVPVSSNQFGTLFTWHEVGKQDTLAIFDTLVVTPDTTTTYWIDANYYGCHVRKYLTVHVLGNAKAYNYNVCWGDTIHLNVGEGSTFNWAPATFLTSSNVYNPICLPINSINYTCIINNNNPLCPIDTAQVAVLVSNSNACFAGDDRTIVVGSSTQLNGCLGASSYSWIPGTGLNDSTVANPIATPTVTTTYRLFVTDPTGCHAVDSIVITVIPAPNIVVPNAFTPNGDLQNDVFLPKAAGLVKLEEFSVFNRWGEKVFSSSDILQGWDGKYKNIPQEMGTYIYYIKGLMADQTIKVFKGNFMLIR